MSERNSYTASRGRRRLRELVATLLTCTTLAAAGCFSNESPAPAPRAAVDTKVEQDTAKASDETGDTRAAKGAEANSKSSEAGQLATQEKPGTSDATKPGATKPDGDAPQDAATAAAKPDAGAEKPAAPPSVDAAGAAANSTTAASAAKPSAAATDQPGRDRFVLLLPDAPLVVELVTTLDGRPLGESLDETLARLLKEGDADHDGRTTWDELTRQPAFQRGVYGNQPIGADNDRRQVIQRYDWNRDKLVSRDELLRWLVRETHRAKALVVDSLVGDRDASRNESLLLKTLDSNRDGALTDDELNTAVARLQARDTDEDEVIVESDLRPVNEMAGATPAAMGRTEGGPSAVLTLGAKTDWATFQRQIQDAYSLGGPLGPDAWPAGADLFQELDVNRDGFVGRSEWSLLRVVDPHLTLHATFGRARDTAAAPSETSSETSSEKPSEAPSAAPSPAPSGDSLQLQHAAPQLASAQAPRTPANSWRFERPGGRLELILTPMPLPDFTAQAQAALAQFDANKNGYLEADEAMQVLAQTGGEFSDVDVDGNEQIVVDEIVTALKRRQSVTLDQVRVQAGFRPDAWWQFADANGDQRLDAREIDTLAARLKTLDRDANGAVERDELPTTFVLSITRGGGDGAVPGLPRTIEGPTAPENLPKWFLHMDANGDGMIGRREFLGEAAQFAELDRNGDGRLEWSEVREWEQKQGEAKSSDASPAKPPQP